MKRLLLLSILLSGILANAQSSLTVNVTNPGTLGVDFHAAGGIDTIVTKLKISGKINASDFTFMRDHISKLSFVDLGDILIDGMQIPPYAFADKLTLTDIVWPKTFFNIGQYAFKGCGFELVLNLPNSLKRIENNAFAGCENLNCINKLYEYTELSIPSSVTNIGDNAFPVFSSIKIAQTIPVPVYRSFLYIDPPVGTNIVYIPYGTTSIYNSIWKDLLFVYGFQYRESFYVVSFDLTREYDPKNDANAIPDILLDHPGKVSLPADPAEMPNYYFGGWYTDSTYTNRWDPDDTIRSNLTVYAKWICKFPHIHFVISNCGIAVIDTFVNYWANFDPPILKRSGYTFNGWFIDSAYLNKWNPNDTLRSSLTIYGKFEISSYRVHYEINGGDPITDTLVRRGAGLDPPTPTRKGYSFSSWYADKYFDPFYIWEWHVCVHCNPEWWGRYVTSDTTLYAKWTINMYTVSFNTLGGNAIADTFINYSTKVSTPEVPVKIGCVFGGWYSDSTFIKEWNFNKDTVTSNLTLYTKWVDNNFCLLSAQFISKDTGFAVGTDGIILKTLNAGKSWERIPSGTTATLKAVLFNSYNTGFIVGSSGLVLKTENRGESWYKLSNVPSGTYLPVGEYTSSSFADSVTGYIAGYGGSVIKTQDNGATWFVSHNDGDVISSISFPNANTGYAFFYFFDHRRLGESISFIKTTDGGNTWTQLSTGHWELILSSHFINESTGCTVGMNGSILRTTDGGITWEVVSRPSFRDLNHLYFLNTDTGYAVGQSGTIVKTINGGTTWTSIPSGTSNNLYSICFTDKNTGYVFGEYGTIIKITDDGGAVFNTVSQTNITCRGNNYGSITVTACGGVPPYKFSLYRDSCYQTSGTFTDLKAGDYTVFMTDSLNHDVYLHAFNILKPKEVSVFLYKNDASCTEDNGSLTVDVIGGVAPYLYSKDEGLYYQTSNYFHELSADTIFILVKDFVGCIGHANIIIGKKASPPVPKITELNNVLYSSSENGNQWFLNNFPIGDSIHQTFTPDQSGIYTVEVTNSIGCAATSMPFNFIYNGINKKLSETNVLVYPNPTNGLMYFDFGFLNITEIKIFDCFGKVVYNSTSKVSSIDLNYLAKGTYFLLIFSDETCIHKKIIIQ